MNKEIPVFLFNGFLDSGKTTLIKEIIEREKGYQDYHTLIIATEDGEVSYDKDWINKYRVNVVIIEDEEYKDEMFFLELIKKYKPSQIVIELNAFVDFNDFNLPRFFAIYQEITLIDASRFELYYNNMKPIINRMVAYASLVVFNRCEDSHNLSKFRRNIRVLNQNTEVAFENHEGKLTTMLDEDLPYDIKGDTIILKEEDFPIWYLDITECFTKYEGKTIVFKAYIRDANTTNLVVGRKIMTCCLDDIQFYGFECLYDKKIASNSYVEVTCKAVKRYSDIANANVIMLEASDIEILDYIEEEYLEFN